MDNQDAERTAGSAIEPPTEFEPKYWTVMINKWDNFLNNKLSNDYKTPLAFVTRKSSAPGWVPVTRDDQLKYAKPLQGALYHAANKAVHGYLKQWLLNTDGWIHIKGFDNTQNGRAADEASRDHYDGPREIEKRVALAESTLNSLFWKDEHRFTFEQFITTLTQCYQEMAKGGRNRTPVEQIDKMRRKINNNNTQLTSVVTNVCMDKVTHPSLADAGARISKEVAKIWPKAHTGRGRARYREISSMNSGRGRGRCRGRGRSGRGGNHDGNRGRGGRGSNIVNGVDITDFYRSYTDAEFKKLPHALKQQILKGPEDDPSHFRNQANRKRKAAAVATIEQDSFSVQEIAHICGIMAASSQHQGEEGDEVSQISQATKLSPSDDAGSTFGRGRFKTGQVKGWNSVPGWHG